jgi:hypothetical protein
LNAIYNSSFSDFGAMICVDIAEAFFHMSATWYEVTL